MVACNPPIKQPTGTVNIPVTVDKHRYPNQFIVNLSDYQLSEPEISILSKGLKFCPTPGYHEVSEVQSDLDHFHRATPIKTLLPTTGKMITFLGSQSWGGPSSMRVDLSEGFNHPKFRNKSTWQPKGPQALEAFAFCNDCQLLPQTDFRRPRDNLSKSERSALKKL